MRDRINAIMTANLEIVMMDRYTEKMRNELAEGILREEKTDLVVAIGPEAASFVWSRFDKRDFPKIYSVILNPEKVIPNIDAAIGIPLNIPPEDQLRLIHQGLSSVTRIGVFFDPAHNSDFFAAASAATSEIDVELVPLSIDSKKDIPFLLEECWDTIDCIWLIPDRTVISESIAQFIIKQAVLNKIPVVGFNQFFYDSGAAMAFVFDYGDLGRQTAELVKYVLTNGGESVAWRPVFNAWLNKPVLNKMGIGIPENIKSPVKVGP